MGRRWAIRTLNFKQVSYESGTLHNHCSDNHEPNSKDNPVPCCEVQQTDFSFSLSMGRRWSIRTWILNKSAMKVVLCTIIVVITSNLIRKITLNMRCSVPCCEVQHFFFWLSMGRRWAIRTLNLKEVSYKSGTLQNHCSDNVEPNSKDNSEYSVLCSLLRGSTFFFLALHGKALGFKNFEF